MPSHESRGGTLRSYACVLALVCLLGFPVSAIDKKFSSGANCVPMNGEQWPRVEFFDGFLRNVADGDTFITCPLTTDQDQDLPVSELGVLIRSGAGSGMIACTAYSQGESVSLAYSRFVSAAQPFTDYAVDWPGSEIERTHEAPVSINCKLPAGAEVRTILLTEFTPTD